MATVKPPAAGKFLTIVNFYNLRLLHRANSGKVDPGSPKKRDEAHAHSVQSPLPGLAENCSSNLLAMPSQSLASAGGVFFAVIFGHALAYSALIESHLSTPGSVSGLIASTGHSGSHTPQSMHSSGWITNMFSPS